MRAARSLGLAGSIVQARAIAPRRPAGGVTAHPRNTATDNVARPLPYQVRERLATIDPRHRPSSALGQRALSVLSANDMGFAVKPSPRLYPHQWNWDSAFIAIGLARFDERRAQREIAQLLRAQWKNGMIPHIVFNPNAKDYVPGPEFWQTEVSKDAPRRSGRVIQTSGHTQPPVLALAAREVFERSRDPKRALAFLRSVYPRLKRFHEFFYDQRDPRREGIIYTVHPWETGRDNAPEWTTLLAKIELEWQPTYERSDSTIVDPSERPTKDQYDRYAYLVEVLRSSRYRSKEIEKRAPFLAQDVLMNALLQRSNEDLLWIAERLLESTRGQHKRRELERDIRRIREWMEKTREGFERLWDEKRGLYFSRDFRRDSPIEINTVATFVPLFAGLPSPDQAERLVREHLTRVDEYWLRYPLPSVAVSEREHFDSKKYWLGPTWVNLNWLVIRGLERYGYHDLAAQLRAKTLEMVEKAGFYEYFDPTSAEGHGTDAFSWSAALILDLAERSE